MDDAAKSQSGASVVASMMSGSFSSAEQAASDPEYRDIRLEVVRIWPERSDGVWLYVEQAAAAALERPYRQRVYRLTTEEAGRVRSDIFLLPGEALAWAGAWREPARFSALTPDALKPRAGCSVFLMQSDPTAAGSAPSWTGGTIGADCPSELGGAKYATTKVTVRDGELLSWDQGFDASGAQVWGATKGGYIFRRTSR
ncbi:MAG: chromophore lyase CpcT/CpeT [Planctomycetota bacterium]|nr:chromophore lyase CpcT/CpeT [Planctomycetota bacterium]